MRQTLIIILLLLSGCSFQEGSGNPRDTLRINLGSEPPTLDWNLATDGTSFDVIGNIMEGLTQYDDNLKPVPAIARSWKTEGNRVTFFLREDAYWSDGVPVTAGDFVYSWRRLLAPETGAEYAYFLYDIVNAEEYNTGRIKDSGAVGIRALDNKTLEVRLKHPVPYFPSITTFMVTFPMRRDVVQKFNQRWTEPENIVTNGPFRLKEWKHEDRIVLEANQRYYGPRPRLQRVEMVMVNEASTGISLYERGQLDFADGRSIPAADIPRLRSRAEYVGRPMLRANYYGFNITKVPFDDVRVRRAFAMAIDRTVIPRVLKGGEVPTTSWVPPGLIGHNPNIGIPFDPAGARKLLAEAGYPGGKGLRPVALHYNTDENNRLVAEVVQAMWKKYLGVQVELVNQEWKVFLKNLTTDPPQVFRLGWSADFADPDNFMNMFTSQSGNNHTRWASQEFDRLIKVAASTSGDEARAALYDRAQQVMLERDVAIVPLFFTNQSTLVKPYVKGMWLNPLGLLRLKTVWIERN